jgi:hypothetical protein
MDALKHALGAKRPSAPTSGSSPDKQKLRDEDDNDEIDVSPDVGVAPDNIGTSIENAPSPNAISDLVKGIMEEHAKETDETNVSTQRKPTNAPYKQSRKLHPHCSPKSLQSTLKPKRATPAPISSKQPSTTSKAPWQPWRNKSMNSNPPKPNKKTHPHREDHRSQ